MNRRQIIIVIAVASLAMLGVIVAGIIPLMQHAGKTKISLLVAPVDSTVTMDGQPSATGDIWVAPGGHTFKATHQYFADAALTVDTAKINAKDPVYLLLGPNTPQALQWLIDHPKDQQIREAAGAKQAEKIQSDVTTKYPIQSSLPHETLNYKISTNGYNATTGKLQLSIQLYAILNRPSEYNDYKASLQQFKTEALKYLTDNGVDLSTVDITYTPDPDKS